MFSKRVRLALTLFTIFFGFLFIYLPGFTKYQDLKRKEGELTREIERLTRVTAQLAEEEKLLAHDPEYLERIAREDLGRVRPGEVIYKIVPVEREKTERAASAPPAAPHAPA